MTPIREGRVVRLTDHCDAVYLFGVAHGRAPGWYLRERNMGGTGHILEGGPYDSPGAAQVAIELGADINGRPPRQTPEEILAEAVLVRTRTQEDPTYRWVGYDTNFDTEARHHDEEWHSPTVIVGADLLWVAEHTRVDSFVKLECGRGFIIGPSVHIASFCHLGIGGGITILEEGSSFGSGAKVISGSNTYGVDHGCSAIAPDAQVTRSFAWVKRNATLYANAVMLPGCVLGEGSVLAAGSVLKANTIVPPHQLWGGVPARFLKAIQ